MPCLGTPGAWGHGSGAVAALLLARCGLRPPPARAGWSPQPSLAVQEQSSGHLEVVTEVCLRLLLYKIE